jgi:hypothetical protein
MDFDGPRRNVEARADHFVRQPLAQQIQHVELAASKADAWCLSTFVGRIRPFETRLIADENFCWLRGVR